jgi:flagellar biosynthesis GTPase FlhF
VTPPVAGDVPIQRTVTQILPGKGDTIEKLLIVGRPDRVFGNSMGDHTTAFATHVEAIKLRMVNKTLPEALDGLMELYSSAVSLPGYGLVAHLPRFLPGSSLHGDRLDTAEQTLHQHFTEAKSAVGGDQTTLALMLQECVNAYLEFRELIPLSAVNVMAVSPATAGKGKGESRYAATLGAHERGEIAPSPELLEAAIRGSFDIHAAALVAATTDDQELATLAPGLPTDTSIDKRVDFLVDQHLSAIKTGFPKGYAASGFSEEKLKQDVTVHATQKLIKDRQLYAEHLENVNKEYARYSGGLGVNSTPYYTEALDTAAARSIFVEKKLALIDAVLPPEKKTEEEETEPVAPVAPVDTEAKAPANEKKRKRVSARQQKQREEQEKKLAVAKKEREKKKKEKEKEPEKVPETVEEPGVKKAKKGDGDKAEPEKTDAEAAEEREEKKLIKEERKSPIATQVVLSRESGKAGQIHKLEIAGRPLSPIPGTMGAHTTAWILHVDAVKQALSGKTIDQAWDTMTLVLVPEAVTLLKTLSDASPPAYEGQQEKAEEALKKLIGYQTSKPTDAPAQTAFLLQQYINDLFTFINYIPGVTREAANTDGRGEAAHRKTLNEYESQMATRYKEAEHSGKRFAYNIPGGEFFKVHDAIRGLLDVKGLENPKVYAAAHGEVVKKLYPRTWAGYVNGGGRIL